MSLCECGCENRGGDGSMKVKCEICGKEYEIIAPAHLKTHGITTKEYREKYPDALLASEATRKKLSEAQLGENNSNYGKKHPGVNAGEKNGMHGVHLTDEKNGMYGKKGWNKGLTKETDERVKKISEIMSEKMTKNWQDPEFIKMMVNSWYRSGQTRPEKGIDGIVQLLYPKEYKFNGNFELGITIGGKIPDFVNVNGKKKAIDMFGDWCHRDDDPQIRIDLFKEYGWDLLVIWQHELEDRDAVIQKIIKFHGVKSDYVLTQKTLDTWVDDKKEDKNGKNTTT